MIEGTVMFATKNAACFRFSIPATISGYTVARPYWTNGSGSSRSLSDGEIRTELKGRFTENEIDTCISTVHEIERIQAAAVK